MLGVRGQIQKISVWSGDKTPKRRPLTYSSNFEDEWGWVGGQTLRISLNTMNVSPKPFRLIGYVESSKASGS